MTDNSNQIDTREKDPSSFKLIFTLGFAGFVSGLVLVGAYLFTKPIIDNNKAIALQSAIYKVIPGCNSYQTYVLSNGSLVNRDSLPDTDGSDAMIQPTIYAGYDSLGSLAGFAIPGEEPGFQDIIKVLFGYDGLKKQIIGYEVLESKETPGLGDKIFKDNDFLVNFESLHVEPEIVAVKPGQKTADNQVVTITGATISSKAVVRLLNNAIDQWGEQINTYMKTGSKHSENKPIR